eukprot:1802901-Prymnesium_polylepis.1
MDACVRARSLAGVLRADTRADPRDVRHAAGAKGDAQGGQVALLRVDGRQPARVPAEEARGPRQGAQPMGLLARGGR